MKNMNDRKYIIEIFDGPGTLTKMLKSKTLNDSFSQDVYITSSFQCIIFLYQINLTDFNILNNIIKYLTKYTIFSKTVNLSTNSSLIQTYPSKECYVQKQVCLILVTTNVNYVINITINNLTHNYKRNDLCKFGGIATYIIQQANEEISIVCTSHTGVYKYRGIYSNTSETLLVIYSYIEYGTINVTLELSTTMCKVVQNHACKKWHFTIRDNNCVIYQIPRHINLYQDIGKYYLRENKITCGYDAQYRNFIYKGRSLEILSTGYIKGM